MLRTLKREDLERLREIHEKHYKEEFCFPDFNRRYLHAFAVELDDKLVTAAIIRPLMEVITLTDWDLSVRDRKNALMEVFEMSAYHCRQDGFHEIHAFVQNPRWQNVLMHRGFKDTKGRALVYPIGE